jgi:hypothetical protein
LVWSSPVFLNDGEGVAMTAVACPSLSQCTAVDYRGMEVTFDPGAPRRWSAYAIDDQSLVGIACPSVSQCVAVDGVGRETTFDPRLAGGAVQSTIDGTGALWGVACPAVSQCTAVDANGRVLTFDPRSPQDVAVAVVTSTKLSAIACPAVSQCTVVDSGQRSTGLIGGGQQLITFNPARPSAATVLQLPGLEGALACPSTRECVATAQQSCLSSCVQGATVTFDPTSAATPTVAARGQLYYVSLDCPTASQCTAMDLSGRQTTFDPGSSSNQTQALIDTVGDWPKGSNAGKIACPSTLSCVVVVAVASGGGEMTFDPLAPRTPRPATVDDGAPNIAVTCPGARECVGLSQVTGLYLPGTIGASARFDPASRVSAPVRFLSVGDPAGFSCPTVSQCTLVTRRSPGFSLRCCQEATFDPRRDSFVDFGAGRTIDGSNLTGVSCPTATQCTAIDARGGEATFNPRRPGHTRRSKIATGSLTSIECVSGSECVAVGRAGQAVTFDPLIPNAETASRIDGHTALVGISCPASDQCAAVDHAGVEITFDPLRGHPETRRRIDTSPLTAISCPTRRFCLAVDRAGRVIGGDPLANGDWMVDSLPGASPLLAVFCASAGSCVAVDAAGHAFSGRARF